MKLELKHLAPYLPYALKIQGTTHGEIAELSCCTETSVNITTRGFQYGMWGDIFEVKPILRPLSDLTDVLDWFVDEKGGAIDFIENEKAIWQISMAPVGGIRTYKTDFLILEPLEGDEEPCILLQTVSDDKAVNKTELLRYDQMMFLIEKHYDVFGLISKGLAVDINTLNKQ